MEKLKGSNMPTTMENIKISDFLDTLQKKYHVTPNQRFTITFDVKEVQEDEEDIEEEFDNVGDAIIAGLEEIIEAKQKGIELPDAIDLVKSL